MLVLKLAPYTLLRSNKCGQRIKNLHANVLMATD